MLGDGPGQAALGRGPSGTGAPEQVDYEHPAAGWGAARSVTRVLVRSREPLEGPRVLTKVNHEDGGFDCPGCAWPDSQDGLKLDFRENGVKHVTWELTGRRASREFFASHTVSEPRSWSDYALEAKGRLVEPMAYDAGSDRYVPIGWADAFALVGEALRGLDSPDQASFYTFVKMATFRATPVGTLNVQPRVAGDLAFLRGVAKAVLERARRIPRSSTCGSWSAARPASSSTARSSRARRGRTSCARAACSRSSCATSRAATWPPRGRSSAGAWGCPSSGHRNADMSDPRWKAIRAVAVAGTPVKAGEVFTASESKVADAVTRGWVKPAPANGRRREKS